MKEVVIITKDRTIYCSMNREHMRECAPELLSCYGCPLVTIIENTQLKKGGAVAPPSDFDPLGY